MTAKYIILATALCFVAVLALTPEELAEERNENFKAQCEKHKGNFDDALDAPNTFASCIKDTKKALEEVKDETLASQILHERLCSKWYRVEFCRTDFVANTQGCYSTEDMKQINQLNIVIVDELRTFVCSHNEEVVKLASFFSEGGVACLEKQKEQLKQCWTTTVGAAPDVVDVVNNIHLSFNKTQCEQLTKLQECVLKEVKKCSSNTTGLESIFNHLMTKASPCKTYNKPLTTPAPISNGSTTTKPPKIDEPTVANTQNATNSTTAAPSTGSASGMAVTSSTIIIAVMTAILY